MQKKLCASFAALLASGVVNAQPAMPEVYGKPPSVDLVATESLSATPIDEPMSPSKTELAEELAPVPDIPSEDDVQKAMLPEGTPIVVMMNDEISTSQSNVGDRFGITVLHDVVDRDTIVIPQGATGYGEVTFRTRKGGFGKPGILGIALRKLEIGKNMVALDGRYREEGHNKNGAVAATWIAVGIFSGFITGKPGVIPRGRELKARTGEDMPFIVGAPPPPVPVPENPEQPEMVNGIETTPSPLPTEENQPSTNEQLPAEPGAE